MIGMGLKIVVRDWNDGNGTEIKGIGLKLEGWYYI